MSILGGAESGGILCFRHRGDPARARRKIVILDEHTLRDFERFSTKIYRVNRDGDKEKQCVALKANLREVSNIVLYLFQDKHKRFCS